MKWKLSRGLGSEDDFFDATGGDFFEESESVGNEAEWLFGSDGAKENSDGDAFGDEKCARKISTGSCEEGDFLDSLLGIGDEASLRSVEDHCVGWIYDGTYGRRSANIFGLNLVRCALVLDRVDLAS
jgi:hypothetical protein